MNAKFFISLGLTLAGVFIFAANSNAQRLKQLTKMYSAQIEDFGSENPEWKTYCINFTENKRVCKGYKSNKVGFEFIVQKDDETLGTWRHPDGTSNGTENFYVYYGDLDKNEFPELVVVSNVNTTQGMGVPTSNVYIATEPIEAGFKKPLVFQVEEFGYKDNFIYDSKNNETLVLATEWDGYDNLDIGRGWGLYLVGRWFRYQKGLLKPVLEKPTLARRYLFSFEKQRWGTLDDNEGNHRPYLWLKHQSTHKFYKEPKETAKRISSQQGIVEKYEEEFSLFENFQSLNKFTIQLDSGEIVVCSTEYPELVYEQKTSELRGVISIRGFGILPQRLVMPSEISPVSVLEKVEGKRVRIETYKGAYDKYHRLWIQSK